MGASLGVVPLSPGTACVLLDKGKPIRVSLVFGRSLHQLVSEVEWTEVVVIGSSEFDILAFSAIL